jgi:hypothetical protein
MADDFTPNRYIGDVFNAIEYQNNPDNDDSCTSQDVPMPPLGMLLV